MRVGAGAVDEAVDAHVRTNEVVPIPICDIQTTDLISCRAQLGAQVRSRVLSCPAGCMGLQDLAYVGDRTELGDVDDGGESAASRIGDNQVVGLESLERTVGARVVLGCGCIVSDRRQRRRGGGHDLLKSFDVKYVGKENVGGVEAAKLELIPRSERVRNIFAKIWLWIDPARGVSVEQQFFEPSGDYHLAQYSDIQINQKIPDNVFKLKTSHDTQYVNGPKG